MCYQRFGQDRHPVPLSGALLDCLTQDLQRLRDRVVSKKSGIVPPSLEAMGGSKVCAWNQRQGIGAAC